MTNELEKTIVDFVRGFKHIKPKGKRGYYRYTEFIIYGKNFNQFKKDYNYPNKNIDGFFYEPYSEINLMDGITNKILIKE